MQRAAQLEHPQKRTCTNSHRRFIRAIWFECRHGPVQISMRVVAHVQTTFCIPVHKPVQLRVAPDAPATWPDAALKRVGRRLRASAASSRQSRLRDSGELVNKRVRFASFQTCLWCVAECSALTDPGQVMLWLNVDRKLGVVAVMGVISRNSDRFESALRISWCWLVKLVNLMTRHAGLHKTKQIRRVGTRGCSSSSLRSF